MKYLFRFTFLLAVAACIAVAFSSCASTCGLFGIASQEYVEKRANDSRLIDDTFHAKQTNIIAAATGHPEIVPAVNGARQNANDQWIASTPPPAAPLDWQTLVLGIVGAITTGAVTYLKVNSDRDAKRVARGEPTAISAPKV